MTGAVPPVLVFAVGNPSRGDDALGPALLARLREHLGAAAADVELIEDFQLQVEHSLDLVGRACVIFIDASVRMSEPFRFEPVRPAQALGAHTHALPPAQLLAVYASAVGGEPPPAWVLRVRGERFELGEGLSDSARANLGQAWGQLRDEVDAARAGASGR